MIRIIYLWRGERHVIHASSRQAAVDTVQTMREQGWQAWIEWA